ncbi:3-deoxy-7-phosphoheptulonate synthase [Spirochaeta cellobiosiphila]|uniref:3-deoxy-7-phosphoheptulonate synthase n=1 Tax=Spirochaeta cellobiosiphila TaxID=504483 RepID=UPI00040D7038|nr:3-deoxy-7-phosphoheptulonate synthase [Spirochaeta cellobiosiphila]
MSQTEDLNIESIEELVSPLELKKQMPISDKAKSSVIQGRKEIIDILEGRDNRMLAIVGPCSIHDPKAALEYAHKLADLKEKLSDKFLFVMRVYFEKPRTTVGWRGLIVDPDIDESYKMEKGLRIARSLLEDINLLGLAVATEVLDHVVPQYISEYISWAAIGARTTESQTHRSLTSGLSMPIGFKNGTDGSLEAAVNALQSSAHSHSFLGVNPEGRISVYKTKGNPYGHIILRGGKRGPNYYEEWVEQAEQLMNGIGREAGIVIDCSHANSGKKYVRQERVLESLITQRNHGHKSVIGFMLESNLFEGNQKIVNGFENLKYGVSVTDECVSWDTTERILQESYDVLHLA